MDILTHRCAMNVYIYQAALWCEECAKAIMEELQTYDAAPAHPENENTFDSGQYPKGPYGQGGGEADSPQHCDGCDLFLENALTSDGVEYVKSFARIPHRWAEFYKGVLND